MSAPDPVLDLNDQPIALSFSCRPDKKNELRTKLYTLPDDVTPAQVPKLDWYGGYLSLAIEATQYRVANDHDEHPLIRQTVQNEVNNKIDTDSKLALLKDQRAALAWLLTPADEQKKWEQIDTFSLNDHELQKVLDERKILERAKNKNWWGFDQLNDKDLSDCKKDVEYQIKAWRRPATPTLNNIARKIGETLNRIRDRAHEAQHLKNGIVGGKKGEQAKISDQLYERKMKRKIRQINQQKEEYVMTPSGPLSLAKIRDGKIRLRVARQYQVLTEMERHARADGLSPIFVTATCPPRMHPNPKKGKNSWDGTLPDQANQWLADRWNTALTRLRQQLETGHYGIKTMEVHDDGCPHTHFLLYIDRSDLQAVEEILRDVFGKTEEACKIKDLDEGGHDVAKAASAATYCMKYIMKGLMHETKLLEGEEVDDEDGDNRNSMATSLWGIRSISFPGCPSFDIMNLLQNQALRDHLYNNGNREVKNLCKACQDGDISTYIRAMGGFGVARKDRPFFVQTDEQTEEKTIVQRSEVGKKKIEISIASIEKSVKEIVEGWQINQPVFELFKVTQEAEKNQPQPQHQPDDESENCDFCFESTGSGAPPPPKFEPLNHFGRRFGGSRGSVRAAA